MDVFLIFFAFVQCLGRLHDGLLGVFALVGLCSGFGAAFQDLTAILVQLQLHHNYLKTSGKRTVNVEKKTPTYSILDYSPPRVCAIKTIRTDSTLGSLDSTPRSIIRQHLSGADVDGESRGDCVTRVNSNGQFIRYL